MMLRLALVALVFGCEPYDPGDDAGEPDAACDPGQPCDCYPRPWGRTWCATWGEACRCPACVPGDERLLGVDDVWTDEQTCNAQGEWVTVRRVNW